MRLGHLCAFADRGARRRVLPAAEAHGDRAIRRPRRRRSTRPRPAVGRARSDPAGARARAAGALGRQAASPGREARCRLGCAAVKVTLLPDVEPRERSVAVGTFDGVHLGHRAVIDGSDSVLTFEPHPVSVVAPQHTPKLLTTRERKAELIASLGAHEVIVIAFDAAFASRTA